jgi:hypothetical protein
LGKKQTPGIEDQTSFGTPPVQRKHAGESCHKRAFTEIPDSDEPDMKVETDDYDTEKQKDFGFPLLPLGSTPSTNRSRDAPSHIEDQLASEPPSPHYSDYPEFYEEDDLTDPLDHVEDDDACTEKRTPQSAPPAITHTQHHKDGTEDTDPAPPPSTTPLPILDYKHYFMPISSSPGSLQRNPSDDSSRLAGGSVLFSTLEPTGHESSVSSEPSRHQGGVVSLDLETGDLGLDGRSPLPKY